jgi:predicted acylesterase/phospholipase RssA
MKNENVYRPRFGKLRAFLRVGTGAVLHGFENAALTFLSTQESVFDNTPLVSTLKNALRKYDQQFAQSSVRCAVAVTNLTHGKKEVFYKMPPGQPLPERQAQEVLWTKVEGLDLLVDCLTGSTALPVLFPPRAHYFDGGVLLNQPISPALRLFEPDVLYVVIPSSQSLGRTQNILDVVSTVLTVWLRMSLDAQIERIKLVNQLIRERTKKEKIRLCVIRASEDLTNRFDVSLITFGKNVPNLVNNGFEVAQQRLDRFNPSVEETWY